MKTKFLHAIAMVFSVSLIFPCLTYTQELVPIKLLQPQTEGGRPLMQALKNRKTDRSFSSEKLPLQTLSNLLNVYLFCASEGLATGVRAFIDKLSLSKALQLRPDQKIVLAQSVGYPKK